jgi:hypothetical protein
MLIKHLKTEHEEKPLLIFGLFMVKNNDIT